ncbi:tetratricopeptide repeat protein 27-like [Oppia nitens]|uniref:tetratricopeptide repeat protein 27-like n=1 Tax=Oppia nitens TaxID=1686743 RepID=UPI0023DB9508|nr:tetratricopeptide repeat protein 27-like [Oppia nitens]
MYETIGSLEVHLFKEVANDCHQWEQQLIDDIIGHKYCSFLNRSIVKDILRDINLNDFSNNLSSIESKFNVKRDQILQIITFFGISCLELYVFDNFVSFITQDIEFDECIEFIKELIHKCDYSLDIDGQTYYSMARNVSLLRLSRCLFHQMKDLISDKFNISLILWRMRSAFIHQITIGEPSDSLFNELLTDSKKIQEFIDTNDNNIGLHLKIELLNELLNIFLWFGDIERIKCNLEKARELSGLKIGLIGALGLRTQFQEKPVAQLKIEINRNSGINGSSKTSETVIDLPKNMALNDDTLLEKIKFIAIEDNENLDNLVLLPSEQILILAYIKSVQRIGSPSDELLAEEVNSYLEFLISKTKIWSVMTNALLMRSLLEKNKRRRVERSMTQINELVDSVRESKLTIIQIAKRSDHFYASPTNPFWITERHLANILVSLGVYKSALDIYLRLNLWDDVIDCYQRIGRRDKAEAVIRELIEEKETPLLYCLLGDVTDDISFYKKSWELSHHKFPRAQKCLGNHFFQKKQYSDCIPYYKLSLEINSMQSDVWSRLAFAAMFTEDYELAATGYRRYIQFETSSFEAWNNLSKAYIKLGQKFRSWKTLQEAIKCNYDEWKIWDNYIAVCVDIGAFTEVIQSWHRLIDIKGQYIDDSIAEILISAICGGINDRNGESAAKLASKAQELFGRISATSNGSTKIWRLYAKLLMNNKVNDSEKVIQCLQKCHRCAVQSNDWQKDPKLMVNILNHCLLLANEYIKCSLMDTTKALRILSSSKLALNSVILLIDKNKDYWIQSDLKDNIEKHLKECQQMFDIIVTKIKEFD